ncbi:MAG: hypothetical protein ACKVT0_21555 [Planctomycetaceae bacterium]
MKTAATIPIAIVGLLVAGGLCWWVYSDRDVVRQIPFESSAWQRAEPIERYRTVRSQMIEDLLRQYDFEGWTREQVETLLGKPASGDPAKMGFEEWDAVYILGHERNGDFSLDDEALGFKFDSTGRVARYGLSIN